MGSRSRLEAGPRGYHASVFKKLKERFAPGHRSTSLPGRFAKSVENRKLWTWSDTPIFLWHVPCNACSRRPRARLMYPVHLSKR